MARCTTEEAMNCSGDELKISFSEGKIKAVAQHCQVVSPVL
jgi:hypothetical protein